MAQTHSTTTKSLLRMIIVVCGCREGAEVAEFWFRELSKLRMRPITLNIQRRPTKIEQSSYLIFIKLLMEDNNKSFFSKNSYYKKKLYILQHSNFYMSNITILILIKY